MQVGFVRHNFFQTPKVKADRRRPCRHSNSGLPPLFSATALSTAVVATAVSTAAYAAKNAAAHGGGGHGGGGGHAARGGGGAHAGASGARHISARPAISRSSVSRSSTRSTSSRSNRTTVAHTPANNSAGQKTLFNSTGSATRNANPNLKSNAVRSTLNSRSVAGALRNTSALRDPRNRTHITATAATAGWHDGRDGGNGWWRHNNGGYGWVGPLYWPFAYYDMYDYAMWGYGYDDLLGLWLRRHLRRLIRALRLRRPHRLPTAIRQQQPERNGARPRRADRSVRPADANVRRRQPRHRRPADRSVPASHPADRRTKRRA